MRNLMFSEMLVLLLCCPLAPAWAGDPGPQPNLCTEDSHACRSLAVEIAMLDIADQVDREVDLRRSTSLLCSEGNPRCCPPQMMPACLQLQKDLIVEARRSYQSVSLSSFGGCPFGPEVCNSFGSFYCSLEERWTPWGGCNTVLAPPSNCRPGWSTNGPNCVPPPPCRCGFEHNNKGICIPKVCYRLGVQTQCNKVTFCGGDQIFVETGTSRPVKSNLGRHLTDRKVQFEAAQRVREDLKLSLEAVEKEIKDLSSY
jgi:hypothetical protein